MKRLLLRFAVLSATFRLSWSLAALTHPLDTIVVAGAGPASLIFSYKYLLSNRFARICIVEKSPRPDTIDQDDAYSFGYGLGGRARAVLNTIPGLLERVESISAFTLSDRWIVNRRELCAEILDAMDKDFEGRIDLLFETELQVFYKDCTVEVVDAYGESRLIKYALLVAGDGANSGIRNALIAKGEIQCTRFLRPVSWKALRLPPQPNLSPGAFLPYPRTPRDFGALIPQRDGTFLLLSYWRRKRRGSQVNPWNSETPLELKECITQAFPEITEFPPDEYLQSFLDELPRTETFMKLDKHAVQSYKVALIGDAAVGMYSLMGQNWAYAMESADRLATSLAESDSLREALDTYSAVSVIQGHAVTDIGLLAHLQEKQGVLKRAMVDMRELTVKLNNPNMPYSEILREHDWKIRLSRLLWRLERLPLSSR
jgi:2-polyprenyl-6-methoxyphenol hydroxylase-like FAD-dependent oxidoreductase